MTNMNININNFYFYVGGKKILPFKTQGIGFPLK